MRRKVHVINETTAPPGANIPSNSGSNETPSVSKGASRAVDKCMTGEMEGADAPRVRTPKTSGSTKTRSASSAYRVLSTSACGR